MPNLIILRLHPPKPMRGSEFRDYLKNLTITVYDITFSSSEGVQIGTASGLADPHVSSILGLDNMVNINDPTLPVDPFTGLPMPMTQILQHYIEVPDPFIPWLGDHLLEAAATAVIVVNPPAGHMEYPTPTSWCRSCWS